jgi:mandelate racemase
MKACDYAMPDFMRIGGVTGWQRAAAIAGGGHSLLHSSLPEVAAHVMRVTETGALARVQDWAELDLAAAL